MIEHRVVGSGDRTVLFMHGLGGDWTNWQPQLDAFGTDHQCISWTMPGYGESQPIDPMTWPALADQALALLAAYDADPTTTTVVGLSMGGMVAQQLAADHPDRLDQLVLVATSPSFGRPNSDFADKYLKQRYDILDAGKTPADLAPAIVEGLLGSDPHADAAANCLASMSRITSDAYRAALACLVTWAFDDQLERITAPTLCIAGAEDTTAPVASMQRLVDGIARSGLSVIDSAGHLVNLERPTEFNELLATFI